MSDVASLEAELKEYQTQLETVTSSLQADTENAELHNLKAELEEVISLTESAIAELKPAPAVSSSKSKPSPAASPAPVKEKWSKEKHPAYQAGYKPPASTHGDEAHQAPATTAHTFAVNDSVLARWRSGDRGFYPARITSITGSSSKPVYIVTFKNYATTETLSANDIKPLSSASTTNNNNNASSSTNAPPSNLKRKADDGNAAATPPPPPPSSSSSSSVPPPPPDSSSPAPPPATTTGVISAAASVDPSSSSSSSSAPRHEPSKVSDGPIRPAKIPRKVKASKELEAGKTKWQAFSGGGGGGSKHTDSKQPAAASGAGAWADGIKMKGGKKESMFRTGEGVTARVGFTGSGQAMRKDPTRSRHVYHHGGDEE